MSELINGKVTVKSIRKVAYKDLLGRDQVELEENRIKSYIEGARILVTGAGGSIGAELCFQICKFNPEKIILFERSETPLFETEMRLKKMFPTINILPVLGDILNLNQISFVFDVYRPEVVFHAAAYKHVPMLELQPWKAVRNNILGSRNVLETSRRFFVQRFVLVSTDKAVRPKNYMGAV